MSTCSLLITSLSLNLQPTAAAATCKHSSSNFALPAYATACWCSCASVSLSCPHNCSCCCRFPEAQLPCCILGLATGLGLDRVQRCKHQHLCALSHYALHTAALFACCSLPSPSPLLCRLQPKGSPKKSSSIKPNSAVFPLPCRGTQQLDRQTLPWTACAGLLTILSKTTMVTWPSQGRSAMLTQTIRPGDALKT